MIVSLEHYFKGDQGMERQLYRSIVQVIKRVNNRTYNSQGTYSVARIVEVWFWAVVHDRPISWACQKSNWPAHLRRKPLPSDATMSRRMRSALVRSFLLQMERRVVRCKSNNNLLWMIDGKPLAISGCSKDRQAGYGRAANGKAKGYKIHVILGKNGSLADWRLAPMNKDERVMAHRMLTKTKIQGYLVADGNYDSNKLYTACDHRGNLQFVAPRRYGPGRGLGNRPQASGRLRSMELLENPTPRFGQWLLDQRDAIERYFGRLTSWGGGLTHLPPWCRTHRRVHRWVQAKMILTSLKP